MAQRYIVFLKDRRVTITENINNSDSCPTDLLVDFTDTPSLAMDYKRFSDDLDCGSLIIKTSNFFVEACSAFNSLFVQVKAAGGLVKNGQTQFLFIKRFGKWDLPKGKLHENETVAEGALREVLEETGIKKLQIIKQLPSTFHIYTDFSGKETLKETFWFEMLNPIEENLIPQLEEDITEVRWFQQSEIQLPVNETYESLKPLLKEYFGLQNLP